MFTFGKQTVKQLPVPTNIRSDRENPTRPESLQLLIESAKTMLKFDGWMLELRNLDILGIEYLNSSGATEVRLNEQLVGPPKTEPALPI
jgi:hypothetical protein